jgi:hypothetical protein
MNGSLQALESALCENTGLSLELYTKKFKEPCLQEQARLFEESYRRHMLSEGLNPETGEPLTEAELEELNEEERIEIFLEKFDTNEKYNGIVFFEWHGKLTGSCKQGREQFIKDNNIDLEKLEKELKELQKE